MLRRIALLGIAFALFLAPATYAGHGGPGGHYYGHGHADVTWSSTFVSVDGVGTSGYLTTNLVTYGEAMAFQMPVTSFEIHVGPSTAPTPVTGTLTVHVPPSTDPWWSTYPGGVPGGIGAGGDITFQLVGYAEHHPHAVTLYGTYTVTGATGQYAGLVSNGQFSGSSTGGGGPAGFGQYFDFGILGSYR